MKTIQFLIFIISAFMLISCGGGNKTNTLSSDSTAVATQTPSDVKTATVKKYPIKSAIVTFDNDRMGTKQKTILYFDDYGAKEVIEKYEGNTVSETDLCDGQTRYKVIFEKKKAFSSGICNRGVAYKFNWKEASLGDKKYKPTKLGNRDVAGKDCEAFSLETESGTTIYAGWNNICLYLEIKSQYGAITMKAVKIEDNVAIPAEKFKVPTGFEVKTGI